MISFYVEGNPIPQGSFKHIGRGIIIAANPKLNQWRDTVAKQAAKAYSGEPITEPVEILLEFFISRPKTVKRDYPTTKPDLDKQCRSILDAISLERFHQLIKDDSQCINLTASKRYGETPGVKITIITKW
jgi:Holliday junction resolvase RusA-like endonuclease